MNRIERLTAILLLLQERKRSAADIAQHFEVSRRTIQRDIDALCEMGIPIAAEVGVAGGYSLPADYSLPPLALTLREALLLRLALSSLSQLSETPFKQERESLLAKVRALLPRQEGEESSPHSEALSLDVPTRPYRTPFLDHLLESAQQQQWVAVTYRSEKGVSQQTILPLHVQAQAGLWYCEAYSYERQGTRVYRVDRFLDVQVAPATPQLDTPAVSIVHVHSSFPEIRIQLTARGVLRLESEPHLTAHVERQEHGGGVLRVRLRFEEYDWLVGILLGMGTDAQVLAPEALRERVRAEARTIERHYS